MPSVPYDNYLAGLHKDEMVMDAGTTASLRRYGIPVSGGGGMSADDADRICDRLDGIATRIERLAQSSDVREQTAELAGAVREGAREMGRVSRNKAQAQRKR